MSVSKEDLDFLNERFSGDEADKMFSAGLLFDTRQSSGSRLIMSSAFIGEQWVIPKDPGFPFIYTGYENSFGKYADSITKSEATVKVIDVISKFMNMPRHIYFYVVQNILTGVYDVIEIQHYESYAETHGYEKPQSMGDMFTPGSIIPENTILASAPTRDSHGNYKMGFNAKMAYVSWSEVEEDGYGISDEFAEKTKFYQIDETVGTINSNSILLNRYGTKENYKAFPDIGEYVKDGILFTNRQLNFAFAASELTEYALTTALDSDSSYPGRGRVIDIDVYINNEDELKNNSNRAQLMHYWNMSKLFHMQIINALEKIVKNKKNKYSYRLQMLYERSLDFMNPDIKFSSNNGVFEFGFIKFVTSYEANLVEGSKITDRSSSKGVTCHIIPKSRMPRDKYGNVADIIQSPPGVPGRANSFQLYEHETNFISFFIRRKMCEAAPFGLEKQFAILYDYIEIIDKEQAYELKMNWSVSSDFDKTEFITDNILNGIYIRKGPFTKTLSYEKICFLYEKYNIHPDRVRVQREIKKHGYDRTLMANLNEDEYYGLFKNKKGELLNTFVSKSDLDDGSYKEIDDEFYVNDETVVKTDHGVYTVKPDKKGIYRNTTSADLDHNITTKKKYLSIKEIDNIISENWTDDTYIVEENDETMVISTLTEEPVIIADKFFVILKHTPESKLSARFIGSTSPLGLPNKTSKTDGNGAISGTPIKYGEMELFNGLIRVDPMMVYRHLSMVSKNPELRSELFNTLLFKDPTKYHDLITPISSTCNDISAKVFFAYNFCLGVEVLEDGEEDIYEPFDNIELTDEQMDMILEKHLILNPVSKL